MDGRQLILIAEDEPDTAGLVAYNLQRRGYRTLIAADGHAALNHTFELKPDLLILDLMLPHLHGYEVCRLLKSAVSTRDIPIIMLTALAATEDKLKGFRLGADDYVTKPFAVRELLARVQALLRRRAEASLRAREFSIS